MTIFNWNWYKYFALMGLNERKEMHVILIGKLVKMKKVHDLADIAIPADPYEKMQHKYNIAKER